MSFNELLAELPRLTLAQRQLLVRQALELDEAPLSISEETVVEQRLAEQYEDPTSAVALEEMKKRLRSRFNG